MNTVERRFGNTTEETSCQCRTGRLAHFWVFLTHGDGQDRSSCTETSEVPGAHWTLDEVVAQSLDVDEHQCIEWPVQTEWNQEWIQHWNQDGEDEWCVTVHPCQAHADGATEPDAERSNQNCGNWDGKQQGQKWHEDHVHSGWNDLLEALVNTGCNQCHNQRHEDVSAVVRQSHVNAQQVDGTGLSA